MTSLDVNTLAYLGSVSLIIPLVQMFKMWVSDAKMYPILSLMLGIALNLIIRIESEVSLVSAIFMGMIAGLIASGLYSTTQANEQINRSLGANSTVGT